MIKKGIIWITVLFVSATSVFALNEKAIIDGTAQFLIERAQQNYLYLFEKKIKSNKMFDTCFPKTKNALNNMDLSLLLTNQKYIKENIVADMNRLWSTFTFKALEKSKSIINDSLLSVGYALYNYDKQLDTTLLHQTKGQIDSLFITINKFKRNKDSLLVYAKTFCELLDTMPIYHMFFNHYLNLLKNDEIKEKLRKNPEIIKFIGDQKYYSVYISNWVDNIAIVCDSTNSFSTRVSSALNVIHIITGPVGKKKFDSFKQICMFFAQIADAENSETVKQILKSVTLPPVSFMMKRNEGKSCFLINAYLGPAVGMEFNYHTSVFLYELSAPICPEYSHGFSWGSVGIFVPIVDFGKAVNAKIYQQETPKFADLFFIGIGAAYGIPNLPLSINLIYSYGPGVKSSGFNRSHVSTSLAFDMPLWVFAGEK
jgi:hypothetical protein